MRNNEDGKKFTQILGSPIIAADIERWDDVLCIKNNFIKNGITPEPTSFLPQEVIDSWVRSKRNNINRDKWPPAPNLPQDKVKLILAENKLMIDATRVFISLYLPILEESNYNMLLYDPSGIILDYALIREDEQISTGGIRSEAFAGTTAHNLAALHKRPVQIIGPINYCKELERNVTSAAPILNEYGELLGTIVLYQKEAKGLWQLGHNLGWITSTAMAISSQLRLFRRDTRLKVMDETFKSALEHVKDAFVSIDSNGHIINFNNEAAKLLKIEGKPKELFFSMITDPETLKKVIKSGLAIQNQPLTFMNGNNYICNVTPFTNGAVIKIFLGEKSKRSKITFDRIIHKSEVMKNLIHTAELVSKNPVNILLLGESGTGKELFAQAIHNSYSNGPFIAINCASMPASLIESELFGYEKGAFTGADREGRKGKIEYANGGTLFLDEIGDMPLELQPVLLRVLEEKRVTRVGGHKSVPVDFRIISATNRLLYDNVKDKLFRSDLYFRLAVVNLEIPPLRERDGDVVLLAERFIQQTCKRFELPPYTLAPDAREIILRYEWPGNVRQLENAMTYAVSFAKNNIITPDNLPREVFEASWADTGAAIKEIKELEWAVIQKAIDGARSMEEAARQLGISRSTLYRRIRKKR